MTETLSDIGEEELLNRLKQYMTVNQIDDDTAEIHCSNNKLLVNTDLLIDEVHFSDLTTSPEDVGWKAIASNCSDLISSGSTELIAFTVGLVAPPSTPWTWVENVYTGMTKALDYFGGKLIGGDCSKGKQKMLSITAIGKMGPIRLHRSHALPEDYIIASGSHGLSRLGLALLTSEPCIKNIELSKNLIKKAITTHQRPSPPQNFVNHLIETKPEGIPFRAAGTDSSDGLLNSIRNICQSSGCQAILKKSSLPKDTDWPIGDMWDNWCLEGGEDYELIICLPKSWAQRFLKKEKNAKIIGSIKKGKPILKWDNQELIKTSLNKFKHF